MSRKFDVPQSQGEALDLFHSVGPATAEELTLARQVATAAIEVYGDLDEETLTRIRNRGIWNDRAEVQAALLAIRMMRSTFL